MNRRTAAALGASGVLLATGGVRCSDTYYDGMTAAAPAWPVITITTGSVLLLLALSVWPWLVQLPLRRTAATRHRSQHAGRAWWRDPTLTYRAQQASIVAVTLTLTGIAAVWGIAVTRS